MPILETGECLDIDQIFRPTRSLFVSNECIESDEPQLPLLSLRHQFIRSFFERDLLQFHPGVAPATMMRFATMLFRYHAQTWNATEIAGCLGVTPPTCRRYLGALSGAFLVRQLQPWHENLAKRRVKAPKIYFRDSGLFHCLSGIRTHADLLTSSQKESREVVVAP